MNNGDNIFQIDKVEVFMLCIEQKEKQHRTLNPN
jgi:hypothetical protein